VAAESPERPKRRQKRRRNLNMRTRAGCRTLRENVIGFSVAMLKLSARAEAHGHTTVYGEHLHSKSPG